MRRFAETYSAPVLQKYLECVKSLESNAVKIQEVTNQVEVFESQDFVIVQQVAAQMERVVEEEELFLQTIISKVGWAHHMILMDKTSTYAEKFWYLLNILENGISRNVLAMQIESGLYKRQVKAQKISNFSDTLPAPQTDFAMNMLKDPLLAGMGFGKNNPSPANVL